MSKLSNAVFVGAVVSVFGLALMMVMSTPSSSSAQPPVAAGPPEPAPPADQTYVGAKRCSSCHLKEYQSWKKTKHFTAFTDMSQKYQQDASCFPCHVTGYAAKGGYAAGTAADVLQNLVGVTCEACHGPGSKHEEIAKPLLNVKKLSPEQDKAVRDSIWKVDPSNPCSRCHAAQGHKEHPKYEK
jgi:hypothetical protein